LFTGHLAFLATFAGQPGLICRSYSYFGATKIKENNFTVQDEVSERSRFPVTRVFCWVGVRFTLPMSLALNDNLGADNTCDRFGAKNFLFPCNLKLASPSFFIRHLWHTSASLCPVSLLARGGFLISFPFSSLQFLFFFIPGFIFLF